MALSTTKMVVIAVIGFFVFCFLAVGGWAMGTYNGLVNLDQQVQGTWGQVENQMQRRGDLIPQLVETVRGYALHEQGAIDSITAARAKLASAQTPVQKNEANTEMSGALSRLLVVAENYPNLKADKHFTDLMREISGTENRISVARGDYNTVVLGYNVKIRSFPGNVLAGMFGFLPKEQFKAEEATKAVPKVDFKDMGHKPAVAPVQPKQ